MGRENGEIWTDPGIFAADDPKSGRLLTTLSGASAPPEVLEVFYQAASLQEGRVHEYL
jgi:hypothetical protein